QPRRARVDSRSWQPRRPTEAPAIGPGTLRLWTRQEIGSESGAHHGGARGRPEPPLLRDRRALRLQRRPKIGLLAAAHRDLGSIGVVADLADDDLVGTRGAIDVDR